MSSHGPARRLVAVVLPLAAIVAGCGSDPLFRGDRLEKTAQPDVETSETLRDALEERAEEWLDDPGLCLALARRYYEEDDLGDARDILEESIEVTRLPATVLQYALFTEYDDDREMLCREAIGLDAGSGLAYAALGDALIVRSLSDRDPETRWEAYRAFARSHEKAPYRRVASWNMVIFRLSIGLQESATTLLEQLIGAWLWPEELAGEDTTAPYFAALATVYAASPQWTDAAKRFRSRAHGFPPLRPATARIQTPPPRPFDERPYLGLGLEGTDVGDPLVVSVVGGSSAAAAGVRPGDRLLAVGGIPVRTTDEAEARVRSLGPTDTVWFTVSRIGIEFELRHTVVTGSQWLTSAERTLENALGLYRDESYEAATEAFADALQYVPRNRPARLHHVSAAYRARRYEQAEQLARTYLADAPRQVHLNELLVLSLNAQGRHEDARRVAERYLARHPASGTFEALLGLQYYNLGEPEQAAARFERAALFGRGGEPARILAKLLDDRDKGNVNIAAGAEADAVWASLLLGSIRGSLDADGSRDAFGGEKMLEKRAREELLDEAARNTLRRERYRQPALTTW